MGVPKIKQISKLKAFHSFQNKKKAPEKSNEATIEGGKSEVREGGVGERKALKMIC